MSVGEFGAATDTTRAGAQSPRRRATGSVDADVFREYAAGGLVPALRPGQVVVMDDLSSH